MKLRVVSMHKLITMLLLGLCICCAVPRVVLAQADEVADIGELILWLDANPNGGSFMLTGNVEVTDYIKLSNVNVDTGDFGFEVTGKLAFVGNTSVIGSGADRPLISVCGGGYLQIEGESNIRVRGTNGAALYFEAGSTYHENDSTRLLIRADGLNSVAIHSETPIGLKGCTIEAADGAGLIHATAPVQLYLAYINAEGAVALSPNVTLDTCVVSTTVTGATIVSRKITKTTPPMPLLMYIGELPDGFFGAQKLLCNITLSAEGVADCIEKAYILFDDSNVKYDKPGDYTLNGEVLPPYNGFDIVGETSSLEITATFYDLGIPYFYSFGNYFGLFSISCYYLGDYEALTLYRSDDGGASWQIYWKYDYEDTGNMIVEYDLDSFHMIFFDPEEFSTPALFVFEVGEGTGIGSDILYVDALSAKNIGNGGDRDSGDRILLPWELFFGNPNDDTGDTGDTGDTDNTGNTGDTGNTGNTGSNVNSFVPSGENVSSPLEENDNHESESESNTATAAKPITGTTPRVANGLSLPSGITDTEPASIGNSGALNDDTTPLETAGASALEDATPSSGLFTALAVGTAGAGGAGSLAYIFRKRRVKHFR